MIDEAVDNTAIEPHLKELFAARGSGPNYGWGGSSGESGDYSKMRNAMQRIATVVAQCLAEKRTIELLRMYSRLDLVAIDASWHHDEDFQGELRGVARLIEASLALRGVHVPKRHPTPPVEPKISRPIYLPHSLDASLRQFCFATSKTRSELNEEALVAYFAKQEAVPAMSAELKKQYDAFDFDNRVLRLLDLRKSTDVQLSELASKLGKSEIGIIYEALGEYIDVLSKSPKRRQSAA